MNSSILQIPVDPYSNIHLAVITTLALLLTLLAIMCTTAPYGSLLRATNVHGLACVETHSGIICFVHA